MIDCGRYSSQTEIKTLGVLHSRKISCYQMISSSQHFSNLKLLYEHEFDRNAYNFISGTFGKSTKEILCV